MADVRLEELSSNNIDDLLQVSVFEHQADFVPSITSSIELASNYDDATCLVIRSDGRVCGFGLYGIDEETGSWKIYRLLIDRSFQGQGIGKQALSLILDILVHEQQANEVLIVYAEANRSAHNLYTAFGFLPYGTRGDRILSKLSCAGGI